MNNPIAADSHLPRKTFHVIAASVVPAAYLYEPFPREWIALTAAALAAVWIGLDLGRLYFPPLNSFFVRTFGLLLKRREGGALTGSSSLLLATVICLYAFPAIPAVAALFYIALGDPAAALIGRRYGRLRLSNGRSLEGGAAMLCVCLLTGAALELPAAPSAMGALAATLAELYSVRLDDNLTVPLAGGCAITVTQWML